MEEIIALVTLVNSSKFKSKGLLNIILEPGTQMRVLYEAIADGTVRSDEDAGKAMVQFGLSAARLQTVKSKLKDRLNDAVLFLDMDEADFGDRQRAFVECAKKWTAAMILLSKNARTNAIQLMEQFLRHVVRFEFTELAIEVLRSLRMHACIITGNQQEFKSYNAQLRTYEDIWRMECEVERLYVELMVDFAITKADKKVMAEQAIVAFDKIKHCLTEAESFKIHLFGRLLQITIYDNQNDYQTVSELSRDAIRFFEAKNYKSLNVLQVFNYSLSTCLLNLRDYDACRAQTEKSLHLFEEGKYNWYKLMEIAFLADIHAGNYEAAVQAHRQVVCCITFQTQPGALTEPWKIYEAYLHLLKTAGKISEKSLPGRFKFQKMLNEIQVYAKDKSGMNVTVQIAQFLFALFEGDYGQCIDREEALAKYRTRYVTLERGARSHYFIRMLECVSKQGFDAAAAREKGAGILQQLHAVPLEAANQNYEVEVIPYEVLWELTLSALATTPQRANLSLAGR